jgi:hypothetical protein
MYQVSATFIHLRASLMFQTLATPLLYAHTAFSTSRYGCRGSENVFKHRSYDEACRNFCLLDTETTFHFYVIATTYLKECKKTLSVKNKEICADPSEVK